MKIATHLLIFGQEKWAMKNIENSYPHVDQIYIAYSKKPWSYNPKAKEKYINSFDLNIIKNSKFYDKITLIEGEWSNEEDQRNSCVESALHDGIDYLMIHDADEFYFHNDFEKIKEFLDLNPNYDIYKCPCINFWKNLNYITLSEHGNEIIGYPPIFINLNKGVRFQNKRNTTSGQSIAINNGVLCHHASYALTNEELRAKLQTWGHHNDFNIKNWYDNIWLKWNENSINLHPVSPSAWSKAIKYTKPLPEVLTE
jgi:hypothetical protein|tara:strand:+ start:321 stop:1085 length:765 start_codon:yes stop_codon:yes gene_type:complete